MQFQFPSPEALSWILTNLLGRPVSVKRAAAPSAAKNQVVAVYSSPASAAGAVCLLELPLGCSLGAALSMIPAPVASQSARAGTIAPNLLENLVEVMNVCAAALSAGAQTRLALGSVVPPGKPLSPEAAAVRAKPAGRADYEVGIGGYEAGVLAVLFA